jgi:hypothetical protein
VNPMQARLLVLIAALTLLASVFASSYDFF